MNNSQIINELVANYEYLSSNSETSQEIIIDKNLKEPNELTKLDSEGIQFILVGDNPGTKEKINQEYFTRKGNGGSAGNYARTFLDIARFYESKRENPFNYLILNKTPFYSSSTKKLNIDSAVEQSIDYVIDTLNKLVKKNPSLLVLIVGIGKSAKLNQEFFSRLHTSMSVQLGQTLRFAKHFSNGNFHDQWLRNDLIGMKNQGVSTLKSNINRIHIESLEVVKRNFKLDFEFRG